MIYDHTNVHIPAHAYVVETLAQLREVISLDTEKGEVVCAHEPVRARPDCDELDTYTLRFRAIHAIGDDGFGPCLFHCYGLAQ